jgi:hypothetical protein
MQMKQREKSFSVQVCVGAKGIKLRVIIYSGGELSQNIYVKGRARDACVCFGCMCLFCHLALFALRYIEIYFWR